MDYDPSYDVASVQSMADELEPYLLSNEVYWQLSGRVSAGRRALPRLTIGGLRLALARLEAVEVRLTPEQRAILRDARTRWQAARAKWAAAVERKAERELNSRLGLWRNFLEDCRDARRQCAQEYPHQASMRVMIEWLSDEARQPTAGKLQQLDARLRACFVSGPFIWASELEASFPAGRFWFLYGGISQATSRTPSPSFPSAPSL